MSATEPAPAPADAPPPPPQGIHKLGQFIEKYSTFLSTFVLGIAGLAGTALYQSQNTKIEQRKAEAAIAAAQSAAETQWKIARAEILSKNLQVLLDKKPETVDQRYGVLLSLTREDVLDPELAMSYAFDLDNSEYIKAVILNIQHKSWAQIFHNFNLTCELRYGIRKNAPICTALDKYEERSDAMTDVVSEELDRGNKDPLKLLSDEKQVKGHLMRLTYLFAPYLEGAWQRERWSDIEAFEKQSRGAQIVASFALAADPAGEAFATADHKTERDKFHAVRQKRMSDLLLSDAGCDVECRGIAAEMLLNGLEEYGQAYSSLLAQMLERSGPEYTQVVQRLHRRLLWCQLSRGASDRMLRDVLVPAWNDVTAKPSKEHDRAKDAIVDLAATLEPPADFKLPEALARATETHRSRVKSDRQAPPPALKKSNFCAAREDESQAVSEDY